MNQAGSQRPIEDLKEALKAIEREIVLNPLAKLSDGFPATIHYIVIREALLELIDIRSTKRES